MAVFGDSISAGYGASSPDHAYANILGSILNYGVDNRAVGGSIIAQQLRDQILPYTQPVELAVFLTGYNDMRTTTPIATYANLLEQALAHLVTKAGKILIGNCLFMTPAGYAAYGPQWNHGSDQRVAEMNQVIAQLCGTYRCSLADLSQSYQPAIHTSADLVHPNDTGHAVIAEAFEAAFNRSTLWLPLVATKA